MSNVTLILTVIFGIGLGAIIYIGVPCIIIYLVYKLIKYYIDKKYDHK